jgi:nucleotide-binding universal stress UspA family protein
LRSEARIIRGPVLRTLLSEAGGVDLVVLGSRGYGPLGNVFLGSVSNEVVHAAPCPVMVVRRRRDG